MPLRADYIGSFVLRHPISPTTPILTFVTLLTFNYAPYFMHPMPTPLLALIGPFQDEWWTSSFILEGVTLGGKGVI